jgi:hypothetical protein
MQSVNAIFLKKKMKRILDEKKKTQKDAKLPIHWPIVGLFFLAFVILFKTQAILAHR